MGRGVGLRRAHADETQQQSELQDSILESALKRTRTTFSALFRHNWKVQMKPLPVPRGSLGVLTYCSLF
jgi:hypothetical protein